MPEQSGGRTDSKDRSSDPSHRKRSNNDHISGSPYPGRIHELQGCIYDTGHGAKDQFSRTTREISEYISRTYNGGGEFLNAFDPASLGFDPIVYPPDPDATASHIDIKKWEILHRQASDRARNRMMVSEQAFGVILGQCSPAVRDRLSAHSAYSHIKANLDVIRLLNLIRSSLYTGSTSKRRQHSSQEGMEKLMTFKQTPRMSNARYLERFKELVEIVEHSGLSISPSDDVLAEELRDIAQDPTNPTKQETQEAKRASKEKYYSVLFLRHSDKRRYGTSSPTLKTITPGVVMSTLTP